MQNESTSKGRAAGQRRPVSMMERMTFFAARNQHGVSGQKDMVCMLACKYLVVRVYMTHTSLN